MYSMKVGSAKSSAAEVYLKDKNPKFWQHVQKFSVPDTASGMRMLRYLIIKDRTGSPYKSYKNLIFL